MYRAISFAPQARVLVAGDARGCVSLYKVLELEPKNADRAAQKGVLDGLLLREMNR